MTTSPRVRVVSRFKGLRLYQMEKADGRYSAGALTELNVPQKNEASTKDTIAQTIPHTPVASPKQTQDGLRRMSLS